VIRPIHAIADTVRRIGAGEPGARVEADNTGPLRPLASGVNEMGERIDQAQADLRQKLHQREAELNLTFDRLRAAERQNAVEDERKRLIRDMHDGLGSQLVQTLNLVRGSGQQVDSRHVATMLQHALEELRITLDSLEPISGDLATVMGTLRQRIAPALSAAGIELIWEVQDAPPVAGLDNQGVLHLFRCLQEVFSNVVQHSGAKQVRVQIHMEGAAVVLRVADDGRGLSPDTLAKGRPGSRGLANIRSRAQWMGVPVRFDTNGTGLAVVFEFQPLAPDSAGSVPAAAAATASASAARVPT
jgi:signal transduction histidine kinase